MDEAYLELGGLVRRGRRCAGWSSDDPRGDRLDCSVGIGPNRLVAKVACDAEKPRGLRRASRASRRAQRFADRPPGLVPGSGPRPPPGSRRWGSPRCGALAATGRVALAERFGARQGPICGAGRGSRLGTSAATGPASRSRARRPSTTTSPSARLEEILRRLAGQLCERMAAQDRRAARSRSGASRRLHDGHPRAHDRRATNDADIVAGVAVSSFASTPRHGRCACSGCGSRRWRRRRSPRPTRSSAGQWCSNL